MPCRRPKIFSHGTFLEIAALFIGYALSNSTSPISGQGNQVFNLFVTTTLQFPSKYTWSYTIETYSKNDEDAIACLQKLLLQFTELRKTKSLDEIRADLHQSLEEFVNNYAEGDAQKTWRKFSAVLFRDNQTEIESLIQPHPQAKILWQSTEPIQKDVNPTIANLLDEIEASYPIPIISGSEEQGDVTIITPDFGPITITLIAGQWKIDASPIIQQRLALKNNQEI